MCAPSVYRGKEGAAFSLQVSGEALCKALQSPVYLKGAHTLYVPGNGLLLACSVL